MKKAKTGLQRVIHEPVKTTHRVTEKWMRDAGGHARGSVIEMVEGTGPTLEEALVDVAGKRPKDGALMLRQHREEFVQVEGLKS
jgi:hypothetical protein